MLLILRRECRILKSLKKLFSILNDDERHKLIKLQVLVILAASFEALTILTVAPLVYTFSRADTSKTSPFFKYLEAMVGVSAPDNLLLFYASIFLVIALFANLLGVITIWKMSVFSAKIGAEISNRLYNFYLTIPYSRFIEIGPSYATKQIATEVSRVVDNILQPLAQINTRVVSSFFIGLALLIYDYKSTLFSLILFSLSYFVIFLFVKKLLHKNGMQLSEINQKRFLFLHEGFGAIQEIRSYIAQEFFLDRFFESSRKYAESYSTLNLLYNLPRYFIELIVYLILISFVINLSIADEASLLPTVLMFGLAGLKLLPNFQQIYSSIAQIKGHSSALDSIYDDLIKCTKIHTKYKSLNRIESQFDTFISLKDISFAYPGNSTLTVNKVSINFPSGSKTAIVGLSGSGKTTLGNIISGLILPDKGEVLYGNTKLNKENFNMLFNNISLVPQFPYIIDASIAENVAFGSALISIDREKVIQSLKASHAYDFTSKLAEGIDTKIGKNGIDLSGGERQRLGIARAIYKNASIFLLDEPTSALDLRSENIILTKLDKQFKNKTLITITHNINAIKHYDNIILLDDGKIIATGNFRELKTKSSLFRSLLSENKKNAKK